MAGYTFSELAGCWARAVRCMQKRGALECFACGLAPAECVPLPARSAPSVAGIGATAVAAPARLRPRLVHVHGSPVKFGSIELRNSVLRVLLFRHFDECEASGLAAVTICDDAHALHASVSCERGVKILLAGLITEISDKNVGHSVC
jgi:hypothetical protein